MSQFNSCNAQQLPYPFESAPADQSNNTSAWDIYYAIYNNANWYAFLDSAISGASPQGYPVMAASLDHRAWCDRFDTQIQLLAADVANLEFEATYGTRHEPWDQQNTEYRNAGISIQQYGLPHDIPSGEGYTSRRTSDTVAEAAPTPSEASTCGSAQSFVRKARRPPNRSMSPIQELRDRGTIPTLEKDHNRYAKAALLVEQLKSGQKIPTEQLDRVIFPEVECVEKVKNQDGTDGLRCNKRMMLVKPDNGEAYWKELEDSCGQVTRSSESYRRHILEKHCAIPRPSRKPDSPSRKSAKRKHRDDAEEPSAPGPSKRRHM